MYHYVYQITNLLNNMIYVGKRSSKKHPDIDPYFGSGVHLRRAIKKYGKENFKKDIIYIVDTVEDAESLEENIVDADFIARKDTYNMIIGGQKGSRGLVMSSETKENLSNKKKGCNLSEEHKANISKGNKGKKRNKLSDDHKANISNFMKENTYAKGHIKSDKTKAKMAELISNTVWVNNGKISKRVKPDEINVTVSSGFTLGRLKRSRFNH